VVGLQVTDLMRTQLGPLSIEKLPEGKWREMTPSEVDALFKALGLG
jgi:16S rRNA U516 pseudouridylate synthase RsuA-like enzyme